MRDEELYPPRDKKAIGATVRSIPCLPACIYTCRVSDTVSHCRALGSHKTQEAITLETVMSNRVTNPFTVPCYTSQLVFHARRTVRYI